MNIPEELKKAKDEQRLQRTANLDELEKSFWVFAPFVWVVRVPYGWCFLVVWAGLVAAAIISGLIALYFVSLAVLITLAIYAGTQQVNK